MHLHIKLHKKVFVKYLFNINNKIKNKIKTACNRKRKLVLRTLDLNQLQLNAVKWPKTTLQLCTHSSCCILFTIQKSGCGNLFMLLLLLLLLRTCIVWRMRNTLISVNKFDDATKSDSTSAYHANASENKLWTHVAATFFASRASWRVKNICFRNYEVW